MNANEYREIWENARNSQDTKSTIDLENILSSTDEMPDYLGGKTIASIARENFEILREHEPELNEWTEKFCEKLVNYRYVDRLCDFRNGRGTKWISKELGKASAGIYLGTRISQNNILFITCKTMFDKCFNLAFDKYLFFQKLSEDEQMILLANEYLKEETDGDDEEFSH